MFVREGTSSDLSRLRWFPCAPDDAPYATEVEAFIRDLTHWLRATPEGVVLVAFEDDDDERPLAVSVLAPYEPGSSVWFISAVAVRLDAVGAELGRRMLQTTIAEATARQAGRPYGRCVWRVDVDNQRMQGMCRSIGYEPTRDIGGGLMEYVVEL